MAIKDLKSKRSKFTDNNMLSAATAGSLAGNFRKRKQPGFPGRNQTDKLHKT